MYLCILGRQPALGLAELESHFGAGAITGIQPDIVQLETDEDPAVFDQLGSTQKAAQLLTRFDSTDWNKAIQQIQKSLPHHFEHVPEGKITLGLSVYGLPASPQQINAAALSFKKTAKQSGRSVRVVPNNEPTLNAAQVIHNKLTGEKGLELLLIKDGRGLILARTVWIQDIEAYRRRDQERPMRDARVGMLPPKLAQTILNLAVNGIEADPVTVLDPFCGTGVLLQETLLNGYNTLGTDLEPRMIEYTTKNLEWLRQTIMRGNPQARHAGTRTLAEQDSLPEAAVKVGDATAMRWQKPFDTIASETYLGRPLSSQPDQETLQKIISDCNTIHRKFLQNVARQTEAGFRLCIAVPAWHTKSGFKHLPVLDHLEELGYNRVSFVHADNKDLVYHRENQIVARELVVLIRR